MGDTTRPECPERKKAARLTLRDTFFLVMADGLYERIKVSAQRRFERGAPSDLKPFAEDYGEDVAFEVLDRVVAKIERDGVPNTREWMTRYAWKAASNVRSNVLRRYLRRRLPATELHEWSGIPEPSAETVALRNEGLAHLDQEIQALPAKAREAILGAIEPIEGKIATSAERVALFRGRKELRKRLRHSNVW